MVNRTGTVYPRGLNKGFSLRFYGGSRVQHETSEEGRLKNSSKLCAYNN